MASTCEKGCVNVMWVYCVCKRRGCCTRFTIPLHTYLKVGPLPAWLGSELYQKLIPWCPDVAHFSASYAPGCSWMLMLLSMVDDVLLLCSYLVAHTSSSAWCHDHKHWTWGDHILCLSNSTQTKNDIGFDVAIPHSALHTGDTKPPLVWHFMTKAAGIFESICKNICITR